MRALPVLPLLLAASTWRGLEARAAEDPEADVPTVAGPIQGETPAPPDEPPASTARGERPYRIGGLVVPLANFNSIDGLGLGLGLEVYDRKRELDYGYRNRLTAWTFWTTSGNYTSNYLQYERRGEQLFVARLAYRVWRNMVYVGVGGEDVSVQLPPERSFGNVVYGPSLLASAIIPLPRNPVYVWAQAYGRYTLSEAAPGTLLEEESPFGLGEAFYFDTSVGLALQEVDRWPVPNKGIRSEVSGRFGGTVAAGDFTPIAGVNAEVIGWWPLVGQWLVLGGRVVFDKTWGQRPWWEQEWLGGQFRDEAAYEQMLTGYARSRTRGDGVLANLLELRGWLGRTRHPFWDMDFYVDVYAESAFLFEGDDLGPHMPTLGASVQLVWQGVVQLRPFVSLGWLSDTPGGPRHATPFFGVSVVDPL
ncbi:MAG: hypothetical protein H6732_08260 [Alphaproteobacteria bacterium]|nr:hypothetical protein [Alphaproteobacteria bacterium]